MSKLNNREVPELEEQVQVIDSETRETEFEGKVKRAKYGNAYPDEYIDIVIELEPEKSLKLHYAYQHEVNKYYSWAKIQTPKGPVENLGTDNLNQTFDYKIVK